jgi:transcriptional regulator with XRE-family HTH domain
VPFGKTLKAARIRAGLSLRRLGAAAGYPFSALSEIENGTRRMPDNPALLARVAGLLGIDLPEARRELELDWARRKPLRLEHLLRNYPEFAAEFYRATDHMGDEELLSLLRGAIAGGGKGGGPGPGHVRSR